jgi:protocatechuate 3,4-dioxygenase, alpha subunit
MNKIGVTASQTVGPFLTIALKADGQEYIVPENSEGALKLYGTVYDGEGEVVPDAVIEVWQANIFGKYNHPEDKSDNQVITDFSGFGRSCTDKNGRFFFVTLKPGRISGRGNTLQAPHIAVNVFARGMLKQQVTRIYFSDEISSNAEDPILNAIEDETARDTLIAKFNGNSDGITGYKFDIHLQGKRETVFFDV